MTEIVDDDVESDAGGNAAVEEERVLVVRDEFPPPHRRPTDSQQQFWATCADPTAEEILFSGAIRSGKTQAACKQIVSWAWNYGGPNWRFAIMRRTYRELEDSTKAAFLRGDGKMPPACPPELIASVRSKDDMVILKNGAEILFRSAEHPADTEDKLRNVTLGGFFIDQVEELLGEDYFQMYETLLSRCSDPRGPRKALLVANPGPEDHWVYRRFVDEHTRERWCRDIHVTLEDNKENLPESYVRSMYRRKETNPQWFKRFILGEWGAFGGKRFGVWDERLHVCKQQQVDPGWELICGIDYGWADPTVAIYCAIDYEGRWWVVGEHYASQKPVSWHVREMKKLEASFNAEVSTYFLDPSAFGQRSEYQSTAQEFADYGIYAGRAQNDRISSHNRIEELMTNRMRDEFPQLRIFDCCTNLIREIPSLRIKDGTDDLVDGSDHAYDALRYAVMSRMPVPYEIEEEEDKDPRDRYAERLLEQIRAREEVWS